MISIDEFDNTIPVNPAKIIELGYLISILLHGK